MPILTPVTSSQISAVLEKMAQLTDQGIVIARLNDRWNQLVSAMRIIFGDDINVDPNSVDGQLLGIFAESINNLEQLAEAVYQSFNPSTATGAALSRLVQLNGIRRIEGAYSVVDLTCTGTAGTVIPAGSLAQGSDGVHWSTTQPITIDQTGVVTVPARAEKMGVLAAAAGTITTIATPIYGWQSVTNPNPASLGRDEETDQELRVRRALSTSTTAQAMLDGLYGALLNLNGVLQAHVYENSTGDVDENGQAAHSILCVVDGGDTQEILETIYRKKSVGVTLLGGVSGVVSDSAGNAQTIRFDRPTDVAIYVTVNVSRQQGYPADGAARIQQAILAWATANMRIGAEVILSQLYTPINTVPGVSVTSLLIGTTHDAQAAANIAVAYNSIARFDPSRITVNEA
jgi:uncharacterized phage protein gp47/JayE